MTGVMQKEAQVKALELSSSDFRGSWFAVRYSKSR